MGTSTAATPAGELLFQTRDTKDAKLIPEDHAVQFHHNVTKLLFVSTRARRDIQTAVAFLTRRVNSPDEDNWGKLKRVTKYLNGTRNLVLTLSADNLGVIRWFNNASYAIYNFAKAILGP